MKKEEFDIWWRKNEEIIEWHVLTAAELERLRITFESAWYDGFLTGYMKKDGNTITETERSLK